MAMYRNPMLGADDPSWYDGGIPGADRAATRRGGREHRDLGAAAEAPMSSAGDGKKKAEQKAEQKAAEARDAQRKRRVEQARELRADLERVRKAAGISRRKWWGRK